MSILTIIPVPQASRLQLTISPVPQASRLQLTISPVPQASRLQLTTSRSETLSFCSRSQVPNPRCKIGGFFSLLGPKGRKNA